MVYIKLLLFIIPALALLIYLTTGYKALRPFRKKKDERACRKT